MMAFDSAHGVAMARIAQAQALLRSADVWLDPDDANTITIGSGRVVDIANKGVDQANAPSFFESLDPGPDRIAENNRSVLAFNNSQSLQSGSSVTPGPGLTIVCVARIANGLNCLASRYNIATPGNWILDRSSAGTLRFVGINDGGTQISALASADSITTPLRIIAVRFSYLSTTTSKLFEIDGTIKDSASVSSTLTSPTTTEIVRIGRFTVGTPRRMTGALGDFAAWPRDLSDEEIRTISWYLRMKWGTA